MIVPNNIYSDNNWLSDLKESIKHRRDLAEFSDVIYRTKYAESLVAISECLSIEIMDKYKNVGSSDKVNYLDTLEEYREFTKNLATNKDSFFKEIIEKRADACIQLLALIRAILEFDYNYDVVCLIKRLAIRTGKAKYLNFGYRHVN